LIVDEYDRYANVCLLDREDVDSDGYKKAVIDSDGPIKRFFSTLKSLEADGYISRLFVTAGCCGWPSATPTPPTTSSSPAPIVTWVPPSASPRRRLSAR